MVTEVVSLDRYPTRPLFHSLKVLGTTLLVFFLSGALVWADEGVRVKISAHPSSGKAPLAIKLEGQRLKGPNPLSWKWFFSDGEVAHGRRVEHTFTQPGRSTVRLEAETKDGLLAKAAIVIKVEKGANHKPRVEVAASPRRGEAPLTVEFRAETSDPEGGALYIAWEFGDGASAEGAEISHTYRDSGKFEAKVTVTDPEGASAEKHVTIAVVPSAADNLEVRHPNLYPTRLAQGPGGELFVSDAKVGSVFIYNTEGSSLSVVGELKGLDRPLGVVVDEGGNIYVGNDGRDNVEVYSPSGSKLLTVDEGGIQKPNDLVLDRRGNLYVADSIAHTIRVYSPAGKKLREIGGPGDGDGYLFFPAALALTYRTTDDGQEVGELYVADQGHARVQVFDLAGGFLRAYGGPVGAFSSDWEGKFVKLQSLAFDAQGRLHAADCYMNRVQILDPGFGGLVASYGSYGTEPGELNLPLDLVITAGGQVFVANAENHRVELIETVP